MRVADEGLMDDHAFMQRLREVGGNRYHDRHPFHLKMNAGELSKGQIRSLGRQPVRVPENHPPEGCRHHGQLPDS